MRWNWFRNAVAQKRRKYTHFWHVTIFKTLFLQYYPLVFMLQGLPVTFPRYGRLWFGKILDSVSCLGVLIIRVCQNLVKQLKHLDIQAQVSLKLKGRFFSCWSHFVKPFTCAVNLERTFTEQVPCVNILIVSEGKKMFLILLFLSFRTSFFPTIRKGIVVHGSNDRSFFWRSFWSQGFRLCSFDGN